MNGKKAKTLRGMFGAGHTYTKAKRDYKRLPTSFAQGAKPADHMPAAKTQTAVAHSQMLVDIRGGAA